VSHTPGSCCLRPAWKRVFGTRHRDLHLLRVSPIQFVLSFGREGERAGFVFTSIVALVLVSSLAHISSPTRLSVVHRCKQNLSAQHHRDETYQEGNQHDYEGNTRDKRCSKPRRSCYGGPSCAVRGDKEKALVEYIARATLPRGVSSNWKQASKLCW